MHSGGEQTSLWEQSDLLDLVAAAPSSAAATADRPGAGASLPNGAPAEDACSDDTALGDARQVAAEEPSAEAIAPAAAPSAPGPVASGALQPGGLPSAAASTDHGAPRPDRGPASAPQAMTAAAADPAPAPGGPDLPPCPERLLILDTETTALSPQQGQCIEVGAVLFDVASRAVLMQVSFLMPCTSNPAEHVNGIPAAVSRLPQPWRSGLGCFEAMVADADVLLAHNAVFDRQWFGHGDLPALDKPWICSMEDIRWPVDRQLRATPSVRDLALAYGVPVWAAHRALTDCIYLVQVFQRCDELESLLQAALEPRHLVRARLSYDERQLAKDAGFRWNEPVPKAWSRRLSEREIAALPFPVDPVEAEDPGRQRRSDPQTLWRRSA